MLIPKVLISLLLPVLAASAPSDTDPFPPPKTAALAGPMSGKALVFSDEFNAPISASKWTGRTSAYGLGNMNPSNDKLDIVTPGAITVADGRARFTATRSDAPFPLAGVKGYTTGLLTTENSSAGFRVRPDDYLETRVQLPKEKGAWPALWTWSGDTTEVDVFEYHPSNPRLLEFVNHTLEPPTYRYADDQVQPGRWVTIGALIGTENVTWYVDNVPVWSDHTGVGRRWSAHIILNLSVNAGKLHPRPTAKTFSLSADWVRVWR